MILFLLIFQSKVFAIDFAKIPTEFCEPVLSVTEKTADCDENKTFIEAAENCVSKLENLERELGLGALELGKKGEANQKEKVSTARAEYVYSQSALEYLLAVSQVAQKQLSEYPDYLPVPGDFWNESKDQDEDPIVVARRSKCYSETEARINKAEVFFKDKIKAFSARKKESLEHQATLQNVKLDSGSSAQELSQPTGKRESTKGVNLEKSQITH